MNEHRNRFMLIKEVNIFIEIYKEWEKFCRFCQIYISLLLFLYLSFEGNHKISRPTVASKIFYFYKKNKSCILR